LHAQPETMIDLLQRIRTRYGSMTEYLRAAGLAQTTLDQLASALLESDR
jgi:hypothetical protein